ncbi:MAG: alpha/beta hydrolase [Cyanobacteria bacterium SZAS LIN-3]|nr:alpha/beta hydrolase [Cyanobacteria bacterium SZAS LIN-3]
MSKKLRGVVKARRIAVVLLAIIVAWVISSPRFLPGLYTSKLFHPDKERGDSAHIAALNAFHDVPNHQLWFSAKDGNQLRGWLFVRPGADKIYILFPGNAGDIPKRLEFFQALLASGASVFVYEPRGFGLSQGKPTIEHICQDGENAYDYVTKTLGYSSRQIVLYGVSLGTTVASHVSTVRAASGLILQSGFSSLPDIAYEKVPFLRIYPRLLFPKSPSLDNVAIVEQPHVPLLVMHGAADTIIGLKHSQKIFARAAGPKTFVVCPHSGHVSVDPRDAEKFVNSLKIFLQTLK